MLTRNAKSYPLQYEINLTAMNVTLCFCKKTGTVFYYKSIIHLPAFLKSASIGTNLLVHENILSIFHL